jgi:hypothetical protein
LHATQYSITPSRGDIERLEHTHSFDSILVSVMTWAPAGAAGLVK